MDRDEPVPTRPRTLVALHWLTVLCVLTAATLVLVRDELDGRAVRAWLLEGHRHAGLLVLLLFGARVGLRIRYGKLQPGGNHPKIVRICAAITHVALYALLLAQPLLGWAMSSAAGEDVHFFGLTLPALVGENEDLADALQSWHIDAAWALLVLVTLHLGAALWHHFVLRDHTLRMMLPRRHR
ncbi:cytochrome b [Luteibacter yeojuensis]|nr:cytochrome b [Luteibacter yeojuensis]